jgi:hypothetical protein
VVKVFKKDNLNLVLKLIRAIKELVVDQLFIIVITNYEGNLIELSLKTDWNNYLLVLSVVLKLITEIYVYFLLIKNIRDLIKIYLE